MNFLQDTFLIANIIGLVNAILNIYWSSKLKSVQVSSEMIRSLREQLEEERELNKDLHEKKNRYKMQYNHLLLENTKMAGELKGLRGSVKL